MAFPKRIFEKDQAEKCCAATVSGAFRKVIYFAKSPDDQKMENFMREKLDEAVWLRT